MTGPTPLKTPTEQISALILAGGQGRRMQGQDKGWVLYQGAPLIAHVVQRISPQCTTVLISCNRHLAEYGTYSRHLLQDPQPDRFEGPVTGILQGLRACPTEFLGIVPVDAPLLPEDLFGRLFKALAASNALASYAHDGQRKQPLFALLKKEALNMTEHWLLQGGKKVHNWLQALNAQQVDFSDQSERFININYPNQLD